MTDLNHSENALAFAVDAVGGLTAAAKICGKSYQAVNKWRKTARLPRTEYSGETLYAQRLAHAASLNGVHFDASWLLGRCRPSLGSAQGDGPDSLKAA
ncbi:helix-turn-helix domain-containing protein [Pseudomonas viridiflava]|uniref:helix-turn-helix domain-containing protein n=1 Tax=Pseudomonas viridiflava TaxID=33069 RepID=UPI001FD3160D|nr:helix-turn-helix domain-containing protein [Pseudomonas viridiflava]